MELVVLSGFEESQNKGNFIERHTNTVKKFWRLAAPYSTHITMYPSLSDHPVRFRFVRFSDCVNLNVFSTGNFVVNSSRDVNAFPGSFWSTNDPVPRLIIVLEYV